MEHYLSFFQYLPTDLTNIIVSSVRDYSDLENFLISFPDLRSLRWPLINFYVFGGEYVSSMTYTEYVRILGIYSFKEKLNLSMSIVELDNLQDLYLKFNKLTDVPREIGILQNLQRLNLSDNQLTDVPKEIGNLHNLEQLDLSFNKLTDVPKEIDNLQNLQGLYLII